MLVGVHQHEPAGRQREHRHVPADLVVVERRLVVQDVGGDGLAGQRVAQTLGDDLGVVAARGDLVEQGQRVVGGHHASVSPSEAG